MQTKNECYRIKLEIDRIDEDIKFMVDMKYQNEKNRLKQKMNGIE